MNIGSLYVVKKYFWLLFPTKETAAAASEMVDTIILTADDAATFAAYRSKQLKCEVTYFSPDSIITFLEEEGKFKKVLTSDGMIGWTWFFTKEYNCFKEVLS